LFSPQTSADQYLQEIIVTGQASQSFTPPALLSLTPFFSLPSFDSTAGAIAFNQGRGSQSNFVSAAVALVASTSVMGAGAGAIYAYGELATVQLTGVGVDFMGSILLGAGAISDVGDMAIGGAGLGAAGGIALLPTLGVGWGIGTLLNPYVQPVISSWYGY
jgi:hypothetical protein